jgi:hypothetical protein
MMLHICTTRGVPMAVRLIRKGDRYGREDCLVHDKDKPLVEFYDTRHASPKWPRGQFLSRYYLRTLQSTVPGTGLMLDGRVPEWNVDDAAMSRVRDFLTGCEAALT